MRQISQQASFHVGSVLLFLLQLAQDNFLGNKVDFIDALRWIAMLYQVGGAEVASTDAAEFLKFLFVGNLVLHFIFSLLIHFVKY